MSFHNPEKDQALKYTRTQAEFESHSCLCPKCLSTLEGRNLFHPCTLSCLISFTQHSYFELCLCCILSFLFDNIPLYRHATVCLSIYLFMDIWVVSSLGLLPIKLL